MIEIEKPKTSLAASIAIAMFLLIDDAGAQTETIVHEFTSGSDGQRPVAALTADQAGNLYGTTSGYKKHCGDCGIGTVFKIDSAGHYSVLHSFTRARGVRDGLNPLAAVILDGAGNIYGTTSIGGAFNSGTVFKLSVDGSLTTLHSFCAEIQSRCGDGSSPVLSGVTMDGAGNLYGTTIGGGDPACIGNNGGCGTVFKLAADGTYSLLHSFEGGSDGLFPRGGLIIDGVGNLYGVTGAGGGTGCSGNGCGTVFMLAPDSTETVLYSFGVSDSLAAPVGPLLQDSFGNLYGSANNVQSFQPNYVFRIAAGGTLAILHTFVRGSGDGYGPEGGLIMDSAGNLFGTTGGGGASDAGTVFELAPDGTETLLFSFGGSGTGRQPWSGVIESTDGVLYGTTKLGGIKDRGLVYELSTSEEKGNSLMQSSAHAHSHKLAIDAVSMLEPHSQVAYADRTAP